MKYSCAFKNLIGTKARQLEKGSVSLLFCLILSGVMTLEAVLLPAARLRYFEAAVPDLANMQLQQVLASYKRPLYERYALAAFTESDNNSDAFMYMTRKQQQSYCIKAKAESLDSLSSTNVLKQEIMQYMKPRWPLALINNFKQRFQDLKGAFGNSNSCIEAAKSADGVKNRLDDVRKKVAETEDEIKQEKSSPQTEDAEKKTKSNRLQKLLQKGLLKALDYCFDGYAQMRHLQAESKLDSQTVSSFVAMFNAAEGIMQKLQSLQVPLADTILLDEYLISFLACAVRNQEQSIPNDNKISHNYTGRRQLFHSLSFSSPYELEACMAFAGGKAAYYQVQTEIFAIRLALQFFAIKHDKVKQSLYLAWGEIIALAAALFGIPVSATAICNFLTAVAAACAAFTDLKKLQGGHTLPLLPEHFVKAGGISGKLAKFPHDYLDYARLFLLFNSQEHKLQRFYQALQANQPGKYYCTTSLLISWCGSRFSKLRQYKRKQSFLRPQPAKYREERE